MARPVDTDQLFLDSTIALLLDIYDEGERLLASDQPEIVERVLLIQAKALTAQHRTLKYRPRLKALKDENRRLREEIRQLKRRQSNNGTK